MIDQILAAMEETNNKAQNIYDQITNCLYRTVDLIAYLAYLEV